MTPEERQAAADRWNKVLGTNGIPFGERRTLVARFWNGQGRYVIIAASINVGIDWAAYIGTTPATGAAESAAEEVVQWGCKLSGPDARFFFGRLKRLPYRE